MKATDTSVTIPLELFLAMVRACRYYLKLMEWANLRTGRTFFDRLEEVSKVTGEGLKHLPADAGGDLDDPNGPNEPVTLPLETFQGLVRACSYYQALWGAAAARGVRPPHDRLFEVTLIHSKAVTYLSE